MTEQQAVLPEIRHCSQINENEIVAAMCHVVAIQINDEVDCCSWCAQNIASGSMKARPRACEECKGHAMKLTLCLPSNALTTKCCSKRSGLPDQGVYTRKSEYVLGLLPRFVRLCLNAEYTYV